MNNPIQEIINFIKHNESGLIDNHRIYPVDYLVIHHTAGKEFINSSDIELQDYFDNTGKKRGYESVRKKRELKEIRSYHTHPKRNRDTYAQAQFGLHIYNLDNNPYGWRLVPLMLKPFDNVAWHAGNWKINQRSIGIEICGDYSDKYIDNNALLLIADTFKFWYNDLKSKGIELKIKGHRDFASTVCPGMIYDQLDIIKDRIKAG